MFRPRIILQLHRARQLANFFVWIVGCWPLAGGAIRGAEVTGP